MCCVINYYDDQTSQCETKTWYQQSQIKLQGNMKTTKKELTKPRRLSYVSVLQWGFQLQPLWSMTSISVFKI